MCPESDGLVYRAARSLQSNRCCELGKKEYKRKRREEDVGGLGRKGGGQGGKGMGGGKMDGVERRRGVQGGAEKEGREGEKQGWTGEREEGR